MKRLMFCVFVVAVSVLELQAQQSAEPKEQVAAAMKVLDEWNSKQPETKPRYLHLVCWTPSDRDFPANYPARLTRIMNHIQEFYAKEMKRHGFGPRSIQLQKATDKEDSLLKLHTVTGLQPTQHYDVQSGAEIRKECLPVLKKAGIDVETETVLIICNLANWDEEAKRFTHKSPYYAGGSFRSGTGWQLDSPELDTLNLNKQQPMIRDGQYGRISLGKHNSIFIGGIAHELGHAIGLPHCAARPDEQVFGTALMGSGNRTYGDELRGEGRGSFLTLAHAMRLASHPQFSGSTKGINKRAAATIDDLSITVDGKAIQIKGVVAGSPPVYGVVAYFDPAGGGDYNATTATAVPDADGAFQIRCDALSPGKSGELRLFPLHVNGSAAGQMSRTRFRYPYNVGEDGQPDLSTMEIKRALEPLLDALNGGERAKANAIVDQIKPPRALEIAKSLTQPAKRTMTPAQFEGDDASVALTRFKTSDVKVGWGRPAFDRVPERSLLLESGGQIFKTGIYAHAPARHVYAVGKRWKTLQGKAGLAAGHGGTVRFLVKGDGKTLWRSKVLRPAVLAEFSVDLAGVEEIELLTETTPDGAGSDWGLWLEPTLVRETSR